MAKLNAKQVQMWLGHHSAAFTLDTYVHLLDDDLPVVDPAAGVITLLSPLETDVTLPEENPAVAAVS